MKNLEKVKNHNFDNGSYELGNGYWVNYNDCNFTLENVNEVITLNCIEELEEYSFLF